MKYLFWSTILFASSFFDLSSRNDYDRRWEIVENLKNEGAYKSAFAEVEQIFELADKEGNIPQKLKAIQALANLRPQFDEQSKKWVHTQFQSQLRVAKPPYKQGLHFLYARQLNSWKSEGNLMETDLADHNNWQHIDPSQYGMGDFDRAILFHHLASIDFGGQEAPKLEKYAEILMDTGAVKGVMQMADLQDYFIYSSYNFHKGSETPEVMGSHERQKSIYEAILNQGQVALGQLSEEQMQLIPASFRFLKAALQKDNVAEIAKVYFRIQLHQDAALALSTFDFVDLQKSSFDFFNALLKQEPSKEVQAYLWYQMAKNRYDSEVKTEEILLEAILYAENARKAAPHSESGLAADAMIQLIKTPKIELHVTSFTQPKERPLAKIKYYHTPRLYFRIIQNQWFEDQRNRLSEDEMWTQYLTQKNLHSGEISVQSPSVYKDAEQLFSLPKLNYGRYILLMSSTPDFSDIRCANQFSVQSIRAVVENIGKTQLVTIIHAKTGKPIEKALVKQFISEFRGREEQSLEMSSQRTNKLGQVNFESTQGRQYFEVLWNKEKIKIENYYYGGWDAQEVQKYTVDEFFTDRAIYRPGQTVFFKILHLQKNSENSTVTRGPKKEVLVRLRNANGEEIAKTEVKLDEFGGGDGSFSLPDQGLPGTFYMGTDHGQHGFQVQAYKRPSFEVILEDIEDILRPNAEVQIRGQIKALAGFEIAELPIKYEVRKVSNFFQNWRADYRFIEHIKIIDQGQLTSDNFGRFTLNYQLPNEVSKNGRQPFYYQVHFFVTDVSGETQTVDAVLRVSGDPIQVKVNLPAIVEIGTKVPLVVTAKNLNDVERSERVEISIEKLQENYNALDPWTLSIEGRKSAINHAIKKWRVERNFDKIEYTTKTKSPDYTFEKSGVYRVTATLKNSKGKEVSDTSIVQVIHSNSGKFPQDGNYYLQKLENNYQKGQTVNLKFGNANPHGALYAKIMRGSELVTSYFSQGQKKVEFNYKVTEEDFGNISVHWFYWDGYVFMSDQQEIRVPRLHKQIKIETQQTRDYLNAGLKESLKYRLVDGTGKPIKGFVISSLYDASLDKFAPHGYNSSWYRERFSRISSNFYGMGFSSNYGQGRNEGVPEPILWQIPEFRDLFYSYYGISTRARGSLMKSMAGNPNTADFIEISSSEMEVPRTSDTPPPPPTAEIPTSEVTSSAMGDLRTNLKETVFFYPKVQTDKDGYFSLDFSMGESLTAWKLLMLAVDPDFAVGSQSFDFKTKKDVMIIANAPRYFRQGDTIYYTARVSNFSDGSIITKPSITIQSLSTSQDVTKIFAVEPEQKLALAAGATKEAKWKLVIPQDFSDAVYVSVRVQANGFSDGEQHLIPILSNKVLLTETHPMVVQKGKSDSYQSAIQPKDYVALSSTLEIIPSPIWHIIQSIPTVHEGGERFAEEVALKFGSLSRVSEILKSNPTILKNIEKWDQNKSDVTNKSPLAQNQDLKNTLLELTPWVQAAQKESQDRQLLKNWTNPNQSSQKIKELLAKIEELQMVDGGFGGVYSQRSSMYTTALVLSWMMESPTSMEAEYEARKANIIKKAIGFLTSEMEQNYSKLLKDLKPGKNLNDYQPSQVDALAIYYIQSFQKASIGKDQKGQWFFKNQLKKFWTKYDLNTQATIGLIAYQDGDQLWKKMERSFVERSFLHPKLGRYWKSGQGYIWRETSIRTHTELMRFIATVAPGSDLLRELGLWLIFQKEVHQWGDVQTTAMAMRALGQTTLWSELKDKNDNNSRMTVLLNGNPIKIDAEIAGLGYFKKRLTATAPDKLGIQSLKIENMDMDLVLGQVYQQYLAPLDAVYPKDNEFVKIKKSFYTTEVANGKQTLVPLGTNPIKPGQLVVARLVIETTRDLSFVDIKDMHPAGFESETKLSGYGSNGSSWYYRAIQDATTHYFIDRLSKGRHVFDLEFRPNYEGVLTAGPSFIQCQYAPAYSAFSKGGVVKVKK